MGGAHPCFGPIVPTKGAGWTAARGACFSHPAPCGTCKSPSIPSGVALPPQQGKQVAPQLQSEGTLMGFILFKPLQTYSKSIPSKFSLQPTKERGAARTWLLLSAAIQLSPLGPCFSSLAIRKAQGTR